MIALAPLTLLAIFQTPMYIPTRPAAILWLLPLALTIALVYKAIKLEPFRPETFVREVLLLFATMVGFLVLIAGILLAISQLLR